jgi:hypothetical protein
MEPEDDKRKTYTLDKDQLISIAEQGAQQAFDKMTNRLIIYIGRGVLERIFWIIGVCFLSLYFWLQSRGIIK